MPETSHRRPDAIAIAAALLCFVAATLTSNHYWDEYFYMFSVSRHSVATLLALEPSLADGIFPNGFFSGKLGFVVLLDGLMALTGASPASIAIVRAIFACIMVGVALASWLLLRALIDDRRRALRTALIVLLLPLSVFLGFKVLSEPPSLLLSMLGGWQFVLGVRAGTRSRHARHLALAIAGFSLGILMRVPSALFMAGLMAATVVLRPGGAAWSRIVADAMIAGIGAVAVSGGVYWAVLGSPFERFNGLAASITSRPPGLAVVGYMVVLFVQLFLPLAIAGAWPPLTRLAKAALLWLAVAMLPYLVTGGYVEPRFFHAALLPLAILAGLGLDRFSSWIRPAVRVRAAVAALAAIVVFNRILFIPLMPYELREAEYSALVDDVRSAHPGATLVTPWLSDFCYLVLAFPEERAVLAMSESYGSGAVFATPEFRRWVGVQHYVADLGDLKALPPPHVYVGWEYNPSVVAFDRLLRPAGIQYLNESARRRLLNHLTPSWIWSSPALTLRPLLTRGAYHAFVITESGPR